MAHNSPPAHSFPQTPITWLVTGSQAPRRLEHDLSPGLKVATMTWDGLSIHLEVVLRALKEKPSAQVAVLSALPGSGESARKTYVALTTVLSQIIDCA